MREVTIRDVARMAGVSVATVSRVVNGQALVGDVTRERVLGAISALDYRPNGVARSLVRRRSGIVGVLVPDIANPFFGEVARGMGDVAAGEGYLLTLANAELDAAREVDYIGLYGEQRVDGLVYTSGPVTPDLAAAFQGLSRPVVLASTWDPAERWPAVLIDSYQGARMAMAHLLDLGHRRIGVLTGPLSDPVSGLPRWQGYRDCAAERGVEIPLEYVAEAGFKQQQAYEMTMRLLRLPEPPTALVAASDLMAVGAMNAAADCGLSVPLDLSVVGFDDVSLATMVRPRLTTVSQPMYEIGAAAMRRLAAVLAGEPISPQVEWVQPRLVVRDSAAPCIG